jgi:hypothetical protein
VGILAGAAQAQHSYPEFQRGVAGYGRYYWHSYTDQVVGNYLSEVIVPAIAREDPRYYTLILLDVGPCDRNNWARKINDSCFVSDDSFMLIFLIDQRRNKRGD